MSSGLCVWVCLAADLSVWQESAILVRSCAWCVYNVALKVNPDALSLSMGLVLSIRFEETGVLSGCLFMMSPSPGQETLLIQAQQSWFPRTLQSVHMSVSET